MKRDETIDELVKGSKPKYDKKEKLSSNSKRMLGMSFEDLSVNRKIDRKRAWTKSMILEEGVDLTSVEGYSDTLLFNFDGYIIESFKDEPNDNDKSKITNDLYEQLSNHFFPNPDEVIHYIYSADDVFIISVVPIVSTKSKGEILVLITTQNGDKILNVSKSIAKAKYLKSPNKEQKFLLHIDPRLTKKKVKRMKSNSEIMNIFHTLCKLDPGYLLNEKTFKVGVVYWKGDIDYNETFSISKCTPQFKKFIKLLGNKVLLENFKGYSGGLDTTKNQDGKYSIYTKWEDKEIMFHVAPMMKSSGHQRKVHIGNDSVVIVFVDSDTPFSPTCIHTTFVQTYILVYIEKDKDLIKKYSKSMKKKESKNIRVKSKKDLTKEVDSTSTYYKVLVLRRDDMPAFGPKIPSPHPVFIEGDDFRKWILEKIISATHASYFSQSYKERVQQNRKQFLEMFSKDM